MRQRVDIFNSFVLFSITDKYKLPKPNENVKNYFSDFVGKKNWSIRITPNHASLYAIIDIYLSAARSLEKSILDGDGFVSPLDNFPRKNGVIITKGTAGIDFANLELFDFYHFILLVLLFSITDKYKI